MGIAVAVARLVDLPEEPEYPQPIEPGFVLGPNEYKFAAPDANAPWDSESEGQVFFGRVWYRDMFDDTVHFSSFILELPSGRGVTQRPNYWARGTVSARALG